MNNHNLIENSIRSLEEKRYTAIMAGDFKTFAELSHPDLSYAHSNGVVDTLDSYLKKCDDGFYIYHKVEHPITSIRVLGDTALVLGEMNAEITAGGVRKSLQNKCLAVWVRSGEHWKLYAYQPTPIA
ncbi:nuclear transport factor 2 family protein (plasmid) [Pseudomonas luteola]|uniref:nuclear transport factor 2 family protein n=1 Tax=Pseudomonas luteola TaxID=47886 RepID=UPI00388FE41C